MYVIVKAMHLRNMGSNNIKTDIVRTEYISGRTNVLLCVVRVFACVVVCLHIWVLQCRTNLLNFFVLRTDIKDIKCVPVEVCSFD